MIFLLLFAFLIFCGIVGSKQPESAATTSANPPKKDSKPDRAVSGTKQKSTNDAEWRKSVEARLAANEKKFEDLQDSLDASFGHLNAVLEDKTTEQEVLAALEQFRKDVKGKLLKFEDLGHSRRILANEEGIRSLNHRLATLDRSVRHFEESQEEFKRKRKPYPFFDQAQLEKMVQTARRVDDAQLEKMAKTPTVDIVAARQIAQTQSSMPALAPKGDEKSRDAAKLNVGERPDKRDLAAGMRELKVVRDAATQTPPVRQQAVPKSSETESAKSKGKTAVTAAHVDPSKIKWFHASEGQ